MSSRPQTSVNASKMKEVNRPVDLHTEFDLMKFLDTYKRSVDYYNSYGLDQRDRSRTEQTQTTRRASTTYSFWDLN